MMDAWIGVGGCYTSMVSRTAEASPKDRQVKRPFFWCSPLLCSDDAAFFPGFTDTLGSDLKNTLHYHSAAFV